MFCLQNNRNDKREAHPGYVSAVVYPGYVSAVAYPGYVSAVAYPGYVSAVAYPGYVSAVAYPGYVSAVAVHQLLSVERKFRERGVHGQEECHLTYRVRQTIVQVIF